MEEEVLVRSNPLKEAVLSGLMLCVAEDPGGELSRSFSDAAEVWLWRGGFASFSSLEVEVRRVSVGVVVVVVLPTPKTTTALILRSFVLRDTTLPVSESYPAAPSSPPIYTVLLCGATHNVLTV